MPVVLITDALFFVLIVAAAVLLSFAMKSPQTMRPLRKLAARRSAMFSFAVLLFYVIVALADSLHFHPRLGTNADSGDARYSGEVISVLDVALAHLRTNTESTYSEPLAAHAFVKTLRQTESGVVQEYPRLLFGGAHLEDVDAGRSADIARRATVGALKGAGIAILVILLAGAALLWRYGVSRCAFYRATTVLLPVLFRSGVRRDGAKWGTVVVTSTVLLAVCGAVLELSTVYHVFGTDKVGQDVLYQAVKSIRTAILIGTLTTLIMLPLALLSGISAGYFLGWIDDVVQYIYTTLNAIPGILLIAAAVLMMHIYMDQHQADFANVTERSDIRLFFLCAILGVTSWSGLCRLLRAETLKIKNLEYIAAARVLGVGHFKVLMRHVLPNVMHIVFITIALDFSGLVLTEAVLSYIDIGVDPAMNSWGNMINSARLEMAREPMVWWSLAASMSFMFVLVLCANLFADAVRDAFDPRLESRQ